MLYYEYILWGFLAKKMSMAVTKAILPKRLVALLRHQPFRQTSTDDPRIRSGKLRFHSLSKVSVSKWFKHEEPETVKPLRQIMAEMETKKKHTTKKPRRKTRSEFFTQNRINTSQ